MNEKYQKFLTTEFVVFDLETSGLDPARDEILEIAGLKLKGKEVVNRFESLVRPTRAISREVESVHGLNEIFLLVNGRPLSEVMKDFISFIADAIIVGHNIKEFDWLFVSNQMKRTGVTAPANKMIDTLELSRKLLPLPRYNLGEIAKHFGFTIPNAHRAMPDVEANARVFLELMELLLNKKT